MEYPAAVGLCATTSLLPSRSTATISCAPQFANHSRPSCQRGDSPITSPVSRMFGSLIECSFVISCSDSRLLWTLVRPETESDPRRPAGIAPDETEQPVLKRGALG